MSVFAARLPSIMYGRRDMLSVPPAMYKSPSPRSIRRAAPEIASMEEMQLFWNVSPVPLGGRPQRISVTRARLGAEKPWPAQPIISPSTASFGRRARSSSASTASCIRSSARREASERATCPIGVRTPAHKTTFLEPIISPLSL